MSVPNPNENPNPNEQPQNPPANTVTPPSKEEKPKVVFTPDVQEEINRLMGIARQEGRDAADKAAKDAAAAADEKRKQDEAVARGEFDKVRADLESDRDGLKGERDRLKADNDDLRAVLMPTMDAQWTAIPDEIKAFYDGGDDDLIAKSKFITKSKPMIDKLTAQQNEKNEALRKVPTTPRPNGNGQGDDAEARKAQASLYRSF